MYSKYYKSMDLQRDENSFLVTCVEKYLALSTSASGPARNITTSVSVIYGIDEKNPFMSNP